MIKAIASDSDGYKTVHSEISRGGCVKADDKVKLPLAAYPPEIPLEIPWERTIALSGPGNGG